MVGTLWVLLLRGEGSRTEAAASLQALLQVKEKAHVRMVTLGETCAPPLSLLALGLHLC